MNDEKYIKDPNTGQFVPDHTLKALRFYRDFGHMPGGFLYNYLSNNLMGAIGKADLENLHSFVAIGYYIYNAMPAAAWGSPQKIEEWGLLFRPKPGMSGRCLYCGQDTEGYVQQHNVESDQNEIIGWEWVCEACQERVLDEYDT